ncbi:hypothetical protein MPS_4788 [Mycobacterium pseudoshottsii JCM 15466]|nr:hypothetical protein MPS_4788 [Mycobacterium pseudoshottsii JCM 15466]
MLVVTPAPALLLVAVPEVPVWLVRAVTPVVGAAQIPVPWGPRAVPSMARVAVSAVAVAEWPPVPARRLPGWEPWPCRSLAWLPPAPRWRPVVVNPGR